MPARCTEDAGVHTTLGAIAVVMIIILTAARRRRK